MAEPYQYEIEAVADHAAARVLRFAVETGGVDWGDYPELDQSDWERVVKAVAFLAEGTAPPDRRFREAYARLADRAQQLEREATDD